MDNKTTNNKNTLDYLWIMKSFSDTTIIIPTLNEEDNIAKVILQLKQLYPEIKIYITDDGSHDHTQVIAKKNGALVIDRATRKVKGISASVTEALRLADTEKVVVMDADLQHPPDKVMEIVQMLEHHDIVIGARKKVIGPWSVLRRLESKFATSLARTRLGREIKDPLSGFFGLRREVISVINTDKFEMRCFKILFNILKSLDLRKKRIGYVYYNFDMRKNGESKIRTKHIYYFIRNLLT